MASQLPICPSCLLPKTESGPLHCFSLADGTTLSFASRGHWGDFVGGKGFAPDSLCLLGAPPGCVSSPVLAPVSCSTAASSFPSTILVIYSRLPAVRYLPVNSFPWHCRGCISRKFGRLAPQWLLCHLGSQSSALSNN